MNQFMKPTNLYGEARRRLDELQMFREKIFREMQGAMPGKIHIVKGASGIKYYLRTDPKDKSGEYIAKRHIEKTRHYLQKSYHEKSLKIIDKEIAKLQAFLKGIDKTSTNLLNTIYSSYPIQSQSLIYPIAITDEEYSKRWQAEPYRGKLVSKSVPMYLTEKGEHVRSKSEINIANALNRYGIPYKYEYPLVINGGMTIYPDFTVLHPKRREVLYWEHRGMMDDQEYARDTVQRLKIYAKEGIYPGRRLIITEETSTSPLETMEIQGIIKEYFQT